MTPDPIEAVARAMAPSAFLPFDRKMHGSPANHEAAKKMWLKNAAAAIAAMPKVEALATENARMKEALEILSRLTPGRSNAGEVTNFVRETARAALPSEPDTIGYVDDTGGAR